MKAIVTGLHELADENQVLLGQCILMTMQANGFPVNDVVIEFQPDDGTGTPIAPPNPYMPKGQG